MWGSKLPVQVSLKAHCGWQTACAGHALGTAGLPHRSDGLFKGIHRWIGIGPLTQDPFKPAFVGCAPAVASIEA